MARPSKQQPTVRPRRLPSSQPNRQPSSQPSGQPATRPRSRPSSQPSRQPLAGPSSQPSIQPRTRPEQAAICPAIQATHRPGHCSAIIRGSTCWSIHPQGSPDLLRRPSQPDSRLLGHLVQPRTHPPSQPSRQPSAQPSRQLIARTTAQPSSQPRLRPTAQPAGPPHYRVRIKLSPVKQRRSSATTSPIQFIVPFSSALVTSTVPSHLPQPVVYHHPANCVTISPIQPSIIQQRLVQ